MISYVFSLVLRSNWVRCPPQFLMSLPKSTTTPTVRHLLSSPCHPYILREKPQTSFLLRWFVFPNASAHPVPLSARSVRLKASERRVQPEFFFPETCFLFIHSARVLLSPVTDSHWFAAGSQSAVVRHPLLEQLEPRRPPQPRPAAGPQLPLPGKKPAQK